MAETAKDCHLFERAVEFYRQARRKEEQLGCTDEQAKLFSKIERC
jgi:hypothetical protein